MVPYTYQKSEPCLFFFHNYNPDTIKSEAAALTDLKRVTVGYENLG